MEGGLFGFSWSAGRGRRGHEDQDSFGGGGLVVVGKPLGADGKWAGFGVHGRDDEELVGGEGGAHLQVVEGFFGGEARAGDAHARPFHRDRAEGDDRFKLNLQLRLVTDALHGEAEAIVTAFESAAALLQVTIDGDHDLIGDVGAGDDIDGGMAIGLINDLVGHGAGGVEDARD